MAIEADDVPPLVDQHCSNGVWRAVQSERAFGSMTWMPTGNGYARLEDQVHVHGRWQAGSQCSMSWTPSADRIIQDDQ